MNAGIGGFAELCALAGEAGGRAPVIALVGAGGKTSTMFALARSFVAAGSRVLVTTTTRLFNPCLRSEREGKGFGPLLLLPDPSSTSSIAVLSSAGPRVVLASGHYKDETKLAGIDPRSVPALAGLFDVILVEADGARGRSVKAPLPTEPVIPPAGTAVIGLVGLDALGAPMDGRIVHRPEIFGPLVGCAPGEAISRKHILRLVISPAGLFQGAPKEARRLLLLNKEDAVPRDLAFECAGEIAACGACDAIFLAAVGKENRS